MIEWNKEYYKSIKDRFDLSVIDLDEKLDSVVKGRVTPAIDDLTIGSARLLRGAVLFFDIRGFSKKVNNSEPETLKDVLYMLNCVIPLVMNIIHDNGGYVEKNTGDGIMAIIGADKSDTEAANLSIDVAVNIYSSIDNIINPFLVSKGIDRIDARIGIDLDNVLVARIGTPKGTAKHDRNFLTAVSPAANIACHIQEMAGTNQIWVGDLVKRYSHDWRQQYFFEVTPSDWQWVYSNTSTIKYQLWKYNAKRDVPLI